VVVRRAVAGMGDAAADVTEIGWGEAAWVSSIAVALLITVVGIALFAILILSSMSIAKVRLIRSFFVNFGVGFAFSFLNLFLLFGAVFAFPAVVINASLVTLIGAADRRAKYASALASSGTVRVLPRFCLYLFVAVISATAGACLIKYTPGVLHKAGEVPSIEWEKDFQTWEGLGGWILVNLGFGVLSLTGGSIAETWMYRRDALEYAAASKKAK